MLSLLCLTIALAQAPQSSVKAPPQKPPSPAKTIAAVAAALPKTGYPFKKTTDDTWVVTIKDENLGTVEIAIRATADVVLVDALVQEKPPLRMESLRELLELNFDANYAKLAIDKDGDLFAMTELPVDFSAAALKSALHEVATLAIEGVGAVASTNAAATEEFPPVAPATGAKLPILRGVFEMSYDPAKWKQQKVDEPGVVQFVHKSGEAYIKVIADRNEVSAEGLRDVVLENARAVAPEVTLNNETVRTVNGLTVRVMRYSGENKGFRFTFYNQLFTDASGNVQLAAWTGSNLFDEYRRDFLELFAGFRKVQR